LTFCYDKFSKPHFAGLCKELAELAGIGDKLAASIFEEAGRGLAQHIVALSPNFSETLLNQPGKIIVSWLQ
jgi:N-acetylglucosamine kinase-like BadF-type ATPase